MKSAILILFLFTSICLYAQIHDPSLIDISNRNDCINALHIEPIDTFGPTIPPIGSGTILEFKDNPKFSTQYIEQEHHTTWYAFTVPFSGTLAFDIIPVQLVDDYDFMLFEYSDSNFCKDAMAKKIVPVRSIISRNDQTIESKTGLSAFTNSQYVHRGPGDSYGAPLEVDSGQSFYLLVDNVYDQGEGHSIAFHYYRTITIMGDVMDRKNSFPVNAKITFETPENREVIFSTQTLGKTGFFKVDLPVSLNENDYLNVSVSAKGYFFSDTILSIRELHSTAGEHLIFMLDKLEEGKRVRIKNIHFYGNVAAPIPSSIPTFEKLYRLMDENPTLKIRLEGHTNGCRGGHNYSINLSRNRTYTIKNYLVKKGIDASRISCKGYACTRMLYPNPKNDQEGQLNRRVEIFVTQY